MRKSIDDIKSAAVPPLAGFSLVLLSIAGFIVALWVIITVVRVVMG
ncbi:MULTISPECIES: hypothetical protein [unclassified Adlercreutzia]|nr:MULTISPECIES: hypothetical protein [unclassified Adlercreutzia]